MPRRRRHYRRVVAIPRPKYSSETVAMNFSLANDGSVRNTYATAAVTLVPPLAAFGRRKCKYFTLRIRAALTYIQGQPSANGSLFQFALVFVPEGTTPSTIGSATPQQMLSMYEPNQNVIIAGVCDNNQVYTFRSRLSRNLNSNDAIFIVCRDLTSNGQTANTIETPITMTFNYAITF